MEDARIFYDFMQRAAETSSEIISERCKRGTLVPCVRILKLKISRCSRYREQLLQDIIAGANASQTRTAIRGRDSGLGSSRSPDEELRQRGREISFFPKERTFATTGSIKRQQRAIKRDLGW